MNEHTSEKKRLGIILICLILVVGLALWVYHSYQSRVDPNTGEISSETMANAEISDASHTEGDEGVYVVALATAPDFSMEDAGGKTVKLSDLKGSPVVLNFWYSGCPHCKKEMPAFEAAYKEYGNRMKFVMLDDVKEERNRDDGKKFVQSSGYTFPVFYDTEGTAMSMYGMRAYPATIFIDANGKIVDKHIGEISEADLVKNLKSLLGE